jgi:hypothetical protein
MPVVFRTLEEWRMRHCRFQETGIFVCLPSCCCVANIDANGESNSNSQDPVLIYVVFRNDMLRNVNGSYRLRSILEVLNLSFCLNEKKILLQKSCYIATPWPGVHTYIFRRGKASHRTRTHWGVWNQRISWDCCSLLPVWPGRSRAGPKLVQNESHLQSQIAELSGTWGVAYTMEKDV